MLGVSGIDAGLGNLHRGRGAGFGTLVGIGEISGGNGGVKERGRCVAVSGLGFECGGEAIQPGGPSSTLSPERKRVWDVDRPRLMEFLSPVPGRRCGVEFLLQISFFSFLSILSELRIPKSSSRCRIIEVFKP